MKVVFASLPAHGHVYPMVSLAMALANAGTEVNFATGDPFLAALPVATVRGIAAGWSFADSMNETIGRLGPPDGAVATEFANVLFAEVNGRQVLGSLLPELERIRPDLVIAEHTNVGALIAARVLGIPAQLFGITDLGRFATDMAAHACTVYASLCDERGVARPSGLSDLVTSRFEMFPEFLQEVGAKPAVQPVALRPVGWSEHRGVPGWLPEPRYRPRAYLTLGTVFSSAKLFERTAVELVDAGFEVVMTLGPGLAEAQLSVLPERVHVEQFVDHPAVLGLVDVVVHHGGSGTALGALSEGLPQILLPQGADQFWNADRLAAEGAAPNLKGEQADGAIGDAAAQVIAPDSSERANSMRLGEIIAARPPPADVAAQVLGDRLFRH